MMKLAAMARLGFPLLFLLFLLLSGCSLHEYQGYQGNLADLEFPLHGIWVDDLGDHWDKGIVDPELEGDWKTLEYIGSEYVSFLTCQDHYIYHRVSECQNLPSLKQSAKTVLLNNHKFLMCLSDTDEHSKQRSGVLYRYTLADDVLTFSEYLGELEPLWQAIERNQMTATLPQYRHGAENWSLPIIRKLNEETSAFVIALADKQDWYEVERCERVGKLDTPLSILSLHLATTKSPPGTLLSISLPDLKYFAEGKTEILLRQLQASPEWKVFQERGEAVCYKRERTNGKWRVSLNGYRSFFLPQGFLCTRPLFRFAREGGGPFRREYNRGWLTTADPLEGEIQLNVDTSTSPEKRSYLAVGQKDLWFEFLERSPYERRPYTYIALQWLEEFLNDIRTAESEIRQTGFAAELLPPDAIGRGKPTVYLTNWREDYEPERDNLSGGGYDIFAWVNPGEPGYVYLKVFSLETEERLSEDDVTPESNELIGWSKDPDTLFFYNSHIMVYEGGFDTHYDARFELWFHPSDSGPEKKLVETTRNITGWER